MSIPKSSDFIAESTDYAAMADIWLRASLAAHGFIPAGYWTENFAAMRDTYLPAAKNYAYRENRVLRGFISLSGGRHIEALFVSPDVQGRGVGRALLDHAKSLCQRLTLAVYEENARAVRFYQANGFEVAERRVDEGTGHPELFMTWG